MILKENRLPLLNRADNPEANQENPNLESTTSTGDATGLEGDISVGVSKNDSMKDIFIKFNTMFLKKFDSLDSTLQKLDKKLDPEKKANEGEDVKKGLSDINKNLGSLIKETEKSKDNTFSQILTSLLTNPAVLTAIGVAATVGGGAYAAKKWFESPSSVEKPGVTMGPETEAGLSIINDKRAERLQKSDPQLKRPLTATIVEAESGGDPNATWGKGGPSRRAWGEGKDFTRMTINQVIAEQDEAKRTNPATRTNDGRRSSAVGLGQIVEGTLQSAINDPASGVTGTDLFNRENQLRIINYKIDKIINESDSAEEFAAKLKATWPTLKPYSSEQLRKLAQPYSETAKPAEVAEPAPQTKNLPDSKGEVTPVGRKGRIEEFKVTPKEQKPKSLEERTMDEMKSGWKKLFGITEKDDIIKQAEREMQYAALQQSYQPQLAPQVTTIDNTSTTIVSKIDPTPKDETYHRGVSLTGAYRAFDV